MKLYAARYWSDPDSYDIVCYDSRKSAKEEPHDYRLSFTKSEWRRLGCRVPKGKYPPDQSHQDDGEVLAVELTAKPTKD